MVYDVIVVGGGPAGLTAGVYARTRKLSTLILEAQATGGQLEWLYPTKSVYDYPSYIAIEGGDSALEIALEIVAAAKKVILVHRREEFRAMEKNVEAVMESPIEVLFNAEVTSLEGDGKVERAVVYDNRTLKKTVLDVDAVIVNIGFEPKITPLPRWGVELEGDRLIRVKADMSTSVRGIYACGDMVSYPGKDKRIVTGCGEAVTAVMSVYKYLKQPYWA